MKPHAALRTAIVNLIVLTLLLPLVFSSCGPAPDTVEDTAGVPRLLTTDYPSELAMTPYVLGSRAPEITVLTSRAELIDYVTLYEKSYTFDDSSLTRPFYDILTDYDEEYFSTQAVVVCVLTAESPAWRYEADGIGRSGDGYDIRIRYSAPASAEKGEIVWHLCLEVPDSAVFVHSPELLKIRLVENKNY